MNGFLDVSGGALEEQLLGLPMETRDPFTSMQDRIRATLKLYEYSDSARGLLEWAQAQTGLDDPLSTHNRQELETIFVRWARNRDAHLASLLSQLRRSHPNEAARIRSDLDPKIASAVQRVHVRS